MAYEQNSDCMIPNFKNIRNTGANMTVFMPEEELSKITDSVTDVDDFSMARLYAYSLQTGKVVGAGEPLSEGKLEFPVWAKDLTPQSTTFGADKGEAIGIRMALKGQALDLFSEGERVVVEFIPNDIREIKANAMKPINCLREEPEAEDSGITENDEPVVVADSKMGILSYILIGSGILVAYNMFFKKGKKK